MTVHTQSQAWSPARTKPVRGVKGFVIGIVAVAAAATGIGIAVSTSRPEPVTVAPSAVTETESQAAFKRFKDDAQPQLQTHNDAREKAYERMINAPWAR